MNLILNYILARAAEASTWRGLALFLSGVAGYHLSDAKVAAIVSIGLAVSGAIGAFLPDKLKG